MPNRYMADISSNNPRFDATEYRKAGHVRIAIKATQGADYVNPDYAAWAKDAHAHGLAVLHYHYCQPFDFDLISEANHFWRFAKPLFLPGDLLCVDVERSIERHGPAGLATYTESLCGQLFNRSKKHVVPYMNESYYMQMASHLDVPGNEYWLAAYGPVAPHPKRGHNLWAWQFTNGEVGPRPHTCMGIGECDVSTLNRATVAADYLRSLRRRR